MAERAKTNSGFTLFEVLAAVAILGVFFVVLANVALDGMRFEGDAERRMRASVLADRFLAEVEHAFSTGVSPPVGATESEEEEFAVSVDVRAFDLAGFAAALGGGAPEEERPDPRSGGAAATPSLLTLPSRGPPPILEVEVLVSWVEGASVQEIRRLTYGFDRAAAGGLLETIVPAEAGGGDGVPSADDVPREVPRS